MAYVTVETASAVRITTRFTDPVEARRFYNLLQVLRDFFDWSSMDLEFLERLENECTDRIKS